MIESFKFRMKSTILHVHRRLKSPAPASICFRSFASSSRDGGQDHYKTLGIGRDASAKEIKAAFYDLSKKYHPDMNPNDKEKAAMKFHNMNAAYEVLGSEEKRKIYDSLTVERHPSHRIQKYQRNMAYQEQNRERTRRAKDWSDLDLDYSDFEHFQRLSRRKRSFTQSSNNTADAFWEAHQKTAENYKNDRVLEREMLERQLLEELEERKRKSTIPVPTFDQLLREERAKKEKHRDKFKNISIIIMSIALFLLIIARYRKPPFGP